MFQSISVSRKITSTWIALILLTLISLFLADSMTATPVIVLAVCITFAVKGQLIVDQLMGLKNATPIIRKLMLAYFLILAPLIAWAIIFPDTVRALTTL